MMNGNLMDFIFSIARERWRSRRITGIPEVRILANEAGFRTQKGEPYCGRGFYKIVAAACRAKRSQGCSDFWTISELRGASGKYLWKK